MEADALRTRARQEVEELGPEPLDAHDRVLWLEERRGAAVLLASLADWRSEVCRRAALESEWDPAVQRVLLDAAQECTG